MYLNYQLNILNTSVGLEQVLFLYGGERGWTRTDESNVTQPKSVYEIRDALLGSRGERQVKHFSSRLRNPTSIETPLWQQTENSKRNLEAQIYSWEEVTEALEVE